MVIVRSLHQLSQCIGTVHTVFSHELREQRSKEGLPTSRWTNKDDALLWFDIGMLQHVRHPVEHNVCICVSQAKGTNMGLQARSVNAITQAIVVVCPYELLQIVGKLRVHVAL